MSKGDRHRSISQKFKNNFDNIKWGNKPSKWANKKKSESRSSHHIMPDIEPYQPVAGEGAFKEVITSRSKEREYLRRNNLQQVGNEKEYFFKHGGKTHDNPTKDW